MIKKINERMKSTKEKLKDGRGSVEFTTIADKSELYDKIKMYSTITIKQGNSIGYHTHTGEKEIMLINKGIGTYKDDENEFIVHPGDVTICEENHYHGISNDDSEDLEIIAMIIKKDA